MPSHATSLAKAAAILATASILATACKAFDPKTGERTLYGNTLWHTRTITEEE